MTNSEKLEQLNRRINDLRVKKIASEKEVERLEKELEDKKNEIKNKYGVEIADFQAAIDVMKKEYDNKMAELEKSVENAENTIKE